MDLGGRISAWLLVRGMTQKALADAVGVSPGAVTAWVKNSSPPTQRNLEKVVEALGVTMAEFYGGSPSPRSRQTTGPDV
jgi:transcriptional regulator with XRE-family HTH domain